VNGYTFVSEFLNSRGFHIFVHAFFWVNIVNVCLPPIEVFQPFPRFQVYYKVLIQTIGYLALNVRGKILALFLNWQNGKTNGGNKTL